MKKLRLGILLVVNVSLDEVHITSSIGTCIWVGHNVYRVSKTDPNSGHPNEVVYK